MGKMESPGAFEPHKENIRAKDEEKERQNLDFHNRGLHDEVPKNERIDEATGNTLVPSIEVGGLDEVQEEVVVDENDTSEDAMGSVPDPIPEDPAELEAWVKKETARLEKQKGAKKSDFKKAA